MTASDRTARLSWLVLAAAMCASASWLLIAGSGLSFASDDLAYWAHYVDHGSEHVVTHGLEFFLAPSNGHLQVFGKLIYELLFQLAGGNYTVFRIVSVAGVMLCVSLFFVLAKRRVGPVPALIPCISLLFLGFGWEALLWAFDMHTIYALAFGLGALLMLERGDRRGDIAACVLLILSIGMIELGLAFAFGIAVSVLIGPDRWRRVWIFLIPLALYACWWIWSRHFHQTTIFWSNVRLIPIDVTNALAAVSGSIFGINATGPEVIQSVTEITAGASVLAGIAVVALVLRFKRGSVPPTIWTFLAVTVAYWSLIALADRPPDSSRYIFVGAVLVFLVAADALRGAAISRPALVAALCVILLAIPANVRKLNEGRAGQRNDGMVSRTEYAMLDLATGHVRADYAPGEDPRVIHVGGGVFTALHAGDYLREAEEVGPIGFSPSEVSEQSPTLRRIADVSLANAFRVKLRPTLPPGEPGECAADRPAEAGQQVELRLPSAGLVLGVPGERIVTVGIRRFADPGEASVTLAKIGEGGWATLKVPSDAAPQPWVVYADGPIDVCPAAVTAQSTP